MSDCQLSLKHKVINNIMLIKGNDEIWSPEEKTQLMERALDIYLSKKRVIKVLDVEPPQKAIRFEEAISEVKENDDNVSYI